MATRKKKKKASPKPKRRGRVRKRRPNGAQSPEQELQVGSAAGRVRVQFARPIEKMDMTVAQAYEFARALFQGAKSAHEKQMRKLAGITAAAVAPGGDAPRILAPDGTPAPRPAVVAERKPKPS